jgi:hypothetical protein
MVENSSTKVTPLQITFFYLSSSLSSVLFLCDDIRHLSGAEHLSLHDVRVIGYASDESA